MTWSLEEYCASQPTEAEWSKQLEKLADSSRVLIEAFQLPYIHPFCTSTDSSSGGSGGVHTSNGLVADEPLPPPQGPLLHHDHLETLQDVIATVMAKAAPSLLGMAELWLRLFASALAPICILHLIWSLFLMGPPKQQQQHEKDRAIVHRNNTIAIVVAISSSLVLCTDPLYLLEFGSFYGQAFLWISIVLAAIAFHKNQLFKMTTKTTTTMVVTSCALMLLLIAWYTSASDHTAVHHHHHLATSTTSIDDQVVQIEEGLYYYQQHDVDKDTRNKKKTTTSSSSAINMTAVIENWPEEYRDYNAVRTRWMPTGDARTGLPFLLNAFIPQPHYTRVWLPVPDGNDNHNNNKMEVIALDIAFPETGYNPNKPVYMVLHGLNGGSSEEYVKEFVLRRTAATPTEQATVIVMVARGLMDLPIKGWNIFHGARWTDVHAAATAIRRAIGPNVVLAGVGYSMGAIILSNYVTRVGEHCPLDTGVAISGGLDMRFQENFYRAQRLWQPILATTLRDVFVIGKWGERVRKRLNKEQMKMLMRATHVTDIDRTAVVVYNGFRDLDHYYTEMSALGDVPLEEYGADQLSPERRINNISIPFCVIHALDDPLVTWRSVVANAGLMHPANLTRTGAGNLVLLLTKRGGHVGWPVGNLPFIQKWQWMSNAAMSFVEAVAKVKKLEQ